MPALRRLFQTARPCASLCANPRLAVAAARYSSHAPMNPAVGTPPRKKVTINTLRKLYETKIPISMVTAYDFPTGHAAEVAGVEIVLVGDSLAMVALGMQDTNQLTLDDMLHHCRATARGVQSAFLVGDLPMGSYEISPEHALRSCIRLVQEGRVEAIKLEGGIEMVPTISRITSVGIPIIGHIGLMPQRQHAFGGFRVQGKTSLSAERLLDDALALQDAGCFALVLEAIPEEVAEIVTQKLSIPTIGIGAGNRTSGQVLVQPDMLANFPEGRFMPKFVKQYESIFGKVVNAIGQYKTEVRSREYPAREHTYPISEAELKAFREVIEDRDAEFGAAGHVPKWKR